MAVCIGVRLRAVKTIQIYDYVDYRMFLRDAVKAKLAAQPRLSLRALAKRAGFASPGYVQMVIGKKRNLTLRSSERLAEVLGLRETEARFFNLLVRLNQARELEEKRTLIDEMYALAKTNPAKALRKIAAIRILGLDFAWYNFVILELATCRSFALTPQNVFRAMLGRVSHTDLVGGFRFLENQGFLRRTAKAYTLAAYTQLQTPDEVQSLNVQELHRNNCWNAERALQLPLKEREFQGITMALSEEKFAELKKLLKGWSQEIGSRFANDPDAENVYQINLQVFPVTDTAASRREWQ